MARKDLLKGLMDAKPDSTPTARVDAARPRYKKGAIGAVSQSIADLKARALVEIDPFAIDDTGLADRIEHDEADHARLVTSLKEHGQQVPIMVRPHPDDPERFLIVYGRRRVLALRDLKMPVKALVRDLDDEAALIAQGQENSARRDLSFIEKCNFARQMVAAGYSRKVVCDALSVDKTLISRMLSVAERIPVEIVEAIGAAHGIGRDRWLKLASAWEAQAPDADTAQDMLAVSNAEGGDARFDVLVSWLDEATHAPAPRAPKAPPTAQKLADGLGEIRAEKASLTLKLDREAASGFEDWLAENIEEIFRDWQNRRGE